MRFFIWNVKETIKAIKNGTDHDWRVGSVLGYSQTLYIIDGKFNWFMEL